MHFVAASNMLLFVVQNKILETGVPETVPECLLWVDSCRLEKILGNLVGLTAVPSPSPYPGIHPVHQFVVRHLVGPVVPVQNIVNGPFPVVR